MDNDLGRKAQQLDSELHDGRGDLAAQTILNEIAVDRQAAKTLVQVAESHNQYNMDKVHLGQDGSIVLSDARSGTHLIAQIGYQNNIGNAGVQNNLRYSGEQYQMANQNGQIGPNYRTEQTLTQSTPQNTTQLRNEQTLTTSTAQNSAQYRNEQTLTPSHNQLQYPVGQNEASAGYGNQSYMYQPRQNLQHTDTSATQMIAGELIQGHQQNAARIIHDEIQRNPNRAAAEINAASQIAQQHGAPEHIRRMPNNTIVVSDSNNSTVVSNNTVNNYNVENVNNSSYANNQTYNGYETNVNVAQFSPITNPGYQYQAGYQGQVEGYQIPVAGRFQNPGQYQAQYENPNYQYGPNGQVESTVNLYPPNQYQQFNPQLGPNGVPPSYEGYTGSNYAGYYANQNRYLPQNYGYNPEVQTVQRLTYDLQTGRQNDAACVVSNELRFNPIQALAEINQAEQQTGGYGRDQIRFWNNSVYVQDNYTGSSEFAGQIPRRENYYAAPRPVMPYYYPESPVQRLENTAIGLGALAGLRAIFGGRH